jgi:hypothetical protein
MMRKLQAAWTQLRLRLALAWVAFRMGPLTGDGETTSPRITAIARRGLLDPGSLSLIEIQSVCGSAFTQAPDRRPDRGNA